MKAETLAGVIWAGAILILALGGALALSAGLMDKDMATRLVMGLNGLVLAWYGNRLPKAVQPDARARQASRVAGRVLVAGGLANAGFWAFAPVDTAIVYGTGAIAAAAAITLAVYGVLLLRMRP